MKNQDITHTNIRISNESFDPMLADLKKQTSQANSNTKKLTGSFNALLKDLKKMTSKQGQAKGSK